MKNSFQVQFYTDPQTGEEFEKLYANSKETAKGRFFIKLVSAYKEKISRERNRSIKF